MIEAPLEEERAVWTSDATGSNATRALRTNQSLPDFDHTGQSLPTLHPDAETSETGKRRATGEPPQDEIKRSAKLDGEEQNSTHSSARATPSAPQGGVTQQSNQAQIPCNVEYAIPVTPEQYTVPVSVNVSVQNVSVAESRNAQKMSNAASDGESLNTSDMSESTASTAKATAEKTEQHLSLCTKGIECFNAWAQVAGVAGISLILTVTVVGIGVTCANGLICGQPTQNSTLPNFVPTLEPGKPTQSPNEVPITKTPTNIGFETKTPTRLTLTKAPVGSHAEATVSPTTRDTPSTESPGSSTNGGRKDYPEIFDSHADFFEVSTCPYLIEHRDEVGRGTIFPCTWYRPSKRGSRIYSGNCIFRKDTTGSDCEPEAGRSAFYTVQLKPAPGMENRDYTVLGSALSLSVACGKNNEGAIDYLSTRLNKDEQFIFPRPVLVSNYNLAKSLDFYLVSMNETEITTLRGQNRCK